MNPASQPGAHGSGEGWVGRVITSGYFLEEFGYFEGTALPVFSAQLAPSSPVVMKRCFSAKNDLVPQPLCASLVTLPLAEAER